MERFRADGHLTDEALRALVQEEPLSELERLELAEHLSFCDICLQRYTDCLAHTALAAPERSCREGLRRRIWQRTARLAASRYATAAAAVVLALTMLWGGGRLPLPTQSSQTLLRQAGQAVTQGVQDIPARWDAALDGLLARIGGALDTSRGTPRTHQGGTHP